MNKTLFFKSGLALVLGLGIGLGAQADDSVAKLSQFKGKVWVNTGKTSVPAQADMPLIKGYRVLVLGDSSARLVYKSGCVLNLEANSSLTVENQEQCKAALLTQSSGAQAAEAGGASATTAGLSEWTPALIAGAAAAGVIIAGVAASNSGGGGGNNPISGE